MSTVVQTLLRAVAEDPEVVQLLKRDPERLGERIGLQGRQVNALRSADALPGSARSGKLRASGGTDIPPSGTHTYGPDPGTETSTYQGPPSHTYVPDTGITYVGPPSGTYPKVPDDPNADPNAPPVPTPPPPPEADPNAPPVPTPPDPETAVEGGEAAAEGEEGASVLEDIALFFGELLE